MELFRIHHLTSGPTLSPDNSYHLLPVSETALSGQTLMGMLTFDNLAGYRPPTT